MPPTPTSDAKPADPPVNKRFQSGLEFDVARSLHDVLYAWQLVYNAYVNVGLIDPNAHGIHLVPQAVHPGTAVIVGKNSGAIASTMSVYADRPTGLPLDHVYRRELDGLRHQGRRLVEVGLFADRREKIERTFAALIELMRHVFYFSIHSGATDIVIGVHPDHASFYQRFLAFETFAEPSVCPAVKDHPMVPLRMKLHECLQRVPLEKGLVFFKTKPLGPEAFENRFIPHFECFEGTPVVGFLHDLDRRRLRSA